MCHPVDSVSVQMKPLICVPGVSEGAATRTLLKSEASRTPSYTSDVPQTSDTCIAGHITASQGQVAQIGRAIAWITQNFRDKLNINELAEEAGMNSSSLHEHFRRVTGMTPLQFQKQLRLQDARVLMLIEDMDATTAAFSVGYESASQFNREYRRRFGAPPARDIASLRGSRGIALTA